MASRFRLQANRSGARSTSPFQWRFIDDRARSVSISGMTSGIDRGRLRAGRLRQMRALVLFAACFQRVVSTVIYLSRRSILLISGNPPGEVARFSASWQSAPHRYRCVTHRTVGQFAQLLSCAAGVFPPNHPLTRSASRSWVILRARFSYKRPQATRVRDATSNLVGP